MVETNEKADRKMEVQKPPFSLLIVSLLLASPQYSCVFFTYERPENSDTTRGGGGDERRDASLVAQYPGDVLRFRLCVYWSAWQTRQDKSQPARFHSTSFVAKDDLSDEQLHYFVTTSNITAVHPTGKRPVQLQLSPLHISSKTCTEVDKDGRPAVNVFPFYRSQNSLRILCSRQPRLLLVALSNRTLHILFSRKWQSTGYCRLLWHVVPVHRSVFNG